MSLLQGKHNVLVSLLTVSAVILTGCCVIISTPTFNTAMVSGLKVLFRGEQWLLLYTVSVSQYLPTHPGRQKNLEGKKYGELLQPLSDIFSACFIYLLGLRVMAYSLYLYVCVLWSCIRYFGVSDKNMIICG